MNRLGNQLFTSARFALDQNGRPALGSLKHPVEKTLHRGVSTHDMVQAGRWKARSRLGPGVHRIPGMKRFIERPLDDEDKRVRPDRAREEAVRPTLERFDSSVRGAGLRHRDERGRGKQSSGLLQKFEAVHPFQIEFDQDHVRHRAFQELERSEAVGCRLHEMPDRREVPLQLGLQGWIALDDEDPAGVLLGH